MSNPTASNSTVVVAEDTARVFTIADFGYSDLDGDPLAAVSITALPVAGELTLNGAPVPLGWFVTAAELNAGKLVFTPAANAAGAGYAGFSFQVSDATSVSVLAYTLTIDVTPVNDAPTAADSTVSVLEDTALALRAADFGFADADDGDKLQSVTFSSLPTAGTLTLFGNKVMIGQAISLSNLDNGQLLFKPAANANGAGYTSFVFQVSDGTAQSGAYTLTVDVTPVRDDLALTGTAGNDTLRGDALDPGSNDTLSGLAGDDLLEGLAGADRLDGGDDDDTLAGGDGDDELLGGAGADRLDGSGGADTLDGGTGNDTLDGGDGNDAYVVRDSGDVVTEASANGGTDTVSSFAAAFTLSANVENGRILATGAADLTGNAGNNLLYAGPGDNIIDGMGGADTLSYENALVGVGGVTVNLAKIGGQATGGSGTDTVLHIEHLVGSRYNDKLTGNAGANRLAGGSGNDSLDGGAGADTLDGGTGNDSYYVRQAGDKVIETYVTAGVDTVYSYLATYTLGNNVDNGRIMLAGAANLGGNGLNNKLQGGKGANVLDGAGGSDTLAGGLGNDTLTGGAGADSFRFDTAPNATSNRDVLADFSAMDDTIVLENTVFAALAEGVLAESAFRSGAGITAAGDASDRIIYNTTTGALYYDADGTGSEAAVQFATAGAGVALLAADFLVS